MVRKFKKGDIITWVLIFSAVFLIMLTGVISYLTFQTKLNQRIVAQDKAFEIAEAGINYSRWHLAHAEKDYSFGGTYDYKDPEGKVIGQYQLKIQGPTGCSQGVKIDSTGWEDNHPEWPKEISVIYAKPSLAKYAFLTNSNVWFGPNENLNGPFHSNGGIRMDGQQNSLSTSAKQTYICGPEHGCSSSNCSSPCSWTSSGCECPGIWGEGSGSQQGLWDFPVSNIDFNKIIQDLANLKTEAQNSGIYLSPTKKLGYHLVFNTDGTLNIYKVTKLQPSVWGYDGTEWKYESNSIDKETLYQTVSLPSDCAPIFVEDNLWINGNINGRATVVAARLPDIPGSEAKVIIPDNISYVSATSVLGIIGQKDILIPLYSPNNLEIKAALLAQKGHIMRYYYPDWWYDPYKTYALRDYIRTYGSIITNTMWTFSWVDSSNNVISGYKTTEMTYNADLTYNPPPYFPVTGDYEITSWQEIK